MNLESTNKRQFPKEGRPIAKDITRYPELSQDSTRYLGISTRHTRKLKFIFTKYWIRTFGLSPKRLIEWLIVLKTERRLFLNPKTTLSLAFYALSALWTGLRTPKAQKSILWRARMGACALCPVYDHRLHACRYDQLGCGCYMPFKSLAKSDTCWIRQVDPNSKFGHKA
jgi:hypothetical protein